MEIKIISIYVSKITKFIEIHWKTKSRYWIKNLIMNNLEKNLFKFSFWFEQPKKLNLVKPLFLNSKKKNHVCHIKTSKNISIKTLLINSIWTEFLFNLISYSDRTNLRLLVHACVWESYQIGIEKTDPPGTCWSFC
jgi:hypothetical protein